MTQENLEEVRKHHREYMRRWREKNPEKAIQSPLWRKLNPEKAKEIDRKNRERDREKRIEYAKKYNPGYYETNKDDFKKRNKLWYETNKENWIDHVKQYRQENAEEISKRKKISRVEISEYIRAFKASKGCNRCKESDPICLEFHHKDRNSKENAIATMISHNVSHKKILKEIEKCIIFCSNCHKKEHYRNGLLGQ